VDYEGERVAIEGGEVVALTNIVAHPAGPTLVLAPVAQSSVSAFGVSYDGTGLSGFSNPFRWSA